jgi:hypothetical protein
VVEGVTGFVDVVVLATPLVVVDGGVVVEGGAVVVA